MVESEHTRRQFVRQASAIALGTAVFPAGSVRELMEIAAVGRRASKHIPVPVDWADIRIDGELLKRTLRNYDRLETEIYKPEHDFQAGGASEGWPGDKEGRIILGLTLQAQATRREPKYLHDIIVAIPKHLNQAGYLGPVLKDHILEQQLSGHGWFLRGLCEYYHWKKIPQVKKYISDIIDHLALPTRGHYKGYPISPESRKQEVGGAAGATQNTVGAWMLSSDIGCAFIFLDGVVQAYSLFPSAELRALIEEMIARFLEIDLVAIKAQAHATLTALRGMLRYYSIAGDAKLLRQVADRYGLYRRVAMTENYENYNWFGRPEWTEACAVIDSFMLAVQLWQHTGSPAYLEDAHHIYYNGICHAQRANGGFGLDNCPGPAEDILTVYADEAWWCCTMRGGEGLASAVQYNYFTRGDELIIPFYNSSTVTLTLRGKQFTLKQLSGYPFEDKIIFEIQDCRDPVEITVKLFVPSWTRVRSLKVNGGISPYRQTGGFISLTTTLKKGTKIELDFEHHINCYHAINREYSRTGHYGIAYGPLLLGCEQENPVSFDGVPRIVRQSQYEWRAANNDLRLVPVYHLMDPRVSKQEAYHKQILFTYG